VAVGQRRRPVLVSVSSLLRNLGVFDELVISFGSGLSRVEVGLLLLLLRLDERVGVQMAVVLGLNLVFLFFAIELARVLLLSVEGMLDFELVLDLLVQVLEGLLLRVVAGGGLLGLEILLVQEVACVVSRVPATLHDLSLALRVGLALSELALGYFLGVIHTLPVEAHDVPREFLGRASLASLILLVALSWGQAVGFPLAYIEASHDRVGGVLVAGLDLLSSDDLTGRMLDV